MGFSATFWSKFILEKRQFLNFLWNLCKFWQTPVGTVLYRSSVSEPSEAATPTVWFPRFRTVTVGWPRSNLKMIHTLVKLCLALFRIFDVLSAVGVCIKIHNMWNPLMHEHPFSRFYVNKKRTIFSIFSCLLSSGSLLKIHNPLVYM